MYLSYLPREATVYDYKMNADSRGTFTELIRTVMFASELLDQERPDTYDEPV